MGKSKKWTFLNGRGGWEKTENLCSKVEQEAEKVKERGSENRSFSQWTWKKKKAVHLNKREEKYDTSC